MVLLVAVLFYILFFICGEGINNDCSSIKVNSQLGADICHSGTGLFWGQMFSRNTPIAPRHFDVELFDLMFLLIK